MKILILWPSGIVEQSEGEPVVRRKVWHSFTEDMNRGDLFVHESTLRLLDYDYMEEVPDISAVSDELYDYYNRNFDYVIIRGSNYIRDDGPLRQWLPFFQRIEIPILAFGIGAQAPSMDSAIELHPDTVAALKEISAKSVHSIGVRGDHSKRLLNGLGIDNVQTIGCPSIFRERNPHVRIRYLPQSHRNLSFTTHPYLGGLYTRDDRNSRAMQVRLIQKLRSSGYHLKYLTQGISAETKIVYKMDQESGINELKEIGWLEDDQGFTDDFIRNAVCFETGNEYYEYSRNSDMNFGTRLHGNITALAMGRPAVFVAYDSRTAELAEFFSIPMLFEDAVTEDFDVEKFLSEVSFSAFNRQFNARYNNFVNFLNDNKIRHRMTEAD